MTPLQPAHYETVGTANEGYYSTTTRVPRTVQTYLKRRELSLAGAIRLLPELLEKSFKMNQLQEENQQLSNLLDKNDARINKLEAENMRLRGIIKQGGNTI